VSKPDTTPTTALAPTDASLVAALRALLREDSAGATGAGASPVGPDANYRAIKDAQEAEMLARPLIEEQHVECRSAETRSTFTAIVSFPRDKDGRPDHRWPRGRVVRLDRYTQPSDAEEKIPKQLTGRERSYHLWVEYFQKDLRAFVGKELPAAARLDMVDRIAQLEAELAAKGATPAAVAK
jgi:hypothetical protein